jgi:hypothetical protein
MIKIGRLKIYLLSSSMKYESTMINSKHTTVDTLETIFQLFFFDRLSICLFSGRFNKLFFRQWNWIIRRNSILSCMYWS